MLYLLNLTFADAEANRRIMVEGLVLVGALLIAALILKWVNSWWRGFDRPPPVADSLATYKLSYERGELSEDEYRRIRALLGARMRPQKPDEHLNVLPDDESPLNPKPD